MKENQLLFGLSVGQPPTVCVRVYSVTVVSYGQCPQLLSLSCN